MADEYPYNTDPRNILPLGSEEAQLQAELDTPDVLSFVERVLRAIQKLWNR